MRGEGGSGKTRKRGRVGRRGLKAPSAGKRKQKTIYLMRNCLRRAKRSFGGEKQ